MTLHAYEAGYADSLQGARAVGVARTLNLYNGRKAPLSLNIVIVGCGIGGLAAAHALGQAGHRVTIVESAPAIGEIGAGIQVTPNLSRILTRWGLASQLQETGVTPRAVALRRWSTGELVGWTQWGHTMEDDFGSPYYHIHRADLHQLLLDLAADFMTLRLNSTVKSVDPSAPSLTLTTGEVIRADLIVGADGVKSMLREVVLGGPVKAVATGDAVYRALIPTSEMIKDPDLKPLVDNPEMTGWMGPHKHIMAYNIRGKKLYNIVLAHPDDGSVESWTAEGSAEKMRADFAGWEPRIEKLLKMVPSTLKWKLMDRQPLPTWIHRDHKLVLLGDSCHPMLPYRAQGAAMAVEDAAVLGNLFSRLSSPSDIPILLRGYESLRHTRTAATQASSRLNQKIFHLPDGPEQEKRDASMRAAKDHALKYWDRERNGPVMLSDGSALKDDDPNWEGSANQWADKIKNEEQFGYDGDKEAEQWWRQKGERLCRNARNMEANVYARM